MEHMMTELDWITQLRTDLAERDWWLHVVYTRRAVVVHFGSMERPGPRGVVIVARETGRFIRGHVRDSSAPIDVGRTTVFDSIAATVDYLTGGAGR